jgi:HPt (histidine-containing phosphotransfer) domain-containing protein
MTNDTINSMIINWDVCTNKFNGDEKFLKQILAVMDDELKKNKGVIKKAYHEMDKEKLSSELHRIRGALSYLRLPELEQAFKEFHTQVKSPIIDKRLLVDAHDDVQKAIENFHLEWGSINS